MKNLLILIILTFILSSCYTVKTMNKQVSKAYVTYPTEFNDAVNKLIPLKETIVTKTDTKYVKGITRIDTLMLKADCDTIKANAEGKKIVYLPGTTRTRVDTFFVNRHDSVVTTNTREINALSGKLEEANKKANRSKTYFWIMIGEAVAILLLVIYRLRQSK